MLQYAPGGHRSEILTRSFFLAKNGDTSPKAELAATIRGWFVTKPDPNKEPRCRYPARYAWLSRQLHLPAEKKPDCSRFRAWAKLRQMKAVSVIMVSGYLGNPASSFGHSLLRFDDNAPDGKPQNPLLDLSFSFGALVPPNANMVSYIFNGLSGGYMAGFSDKLYFHEDEVYTHQDRRDMWSYRINLTPHQRFMVAAHLWEIAGKKFRYYFLTKNCTYRMAQVLQLATGLPITPKARLWYAPIELFYRLKGMDNTNGQPMVSSVTFIPSAQRNLNATFGALKPGQRGIVDRLIRDHTVDIGNHLSGQAFPVREREIDALLAYDEYKTVKNDGKAPAWIKKAKRHALIARLAMPPRKGHAARPPHIKAPTHEHPTLRTAVGWYAGVRGRRVLLDWAPYYRDALSSLTPSPKALIALNTRLSVSMRGDVRLEGLDVIRIRQLQVGHVPIPGQSHLSWSLRLGMERDPFLSDKIGPSLSGGAGEAYAVGGKAVVYGMLTGGARAMNAHIGIGPKVGILWRGGRVRFDLHETLRKRLLTSGFDNRLGIDAQVRITHHTLLQVGWRTNWHRQYAMVTINRFW